jgi:hypothetical protein
MDWWEVEMDTKSNEISRQLDARRERMIRELQSDMADLVRSGDLTAAEANEWVNHKADQWAQELG